MQAKFILTIGLAAFIALFPVPSRGDSNFRCGDNLVSVGDTIYQVMNTCGSPDSREFGVVEEKVQGKKRHRTKKVIMVPGKKYEYPSSGDEIWHYDCGTDGFVYILTFSKSRLTSITTGGRGTHKGLPCPMSSEWTRRKELAR